MIENNNTVSKDLEKAEREETQSREATPPQPTIPNAENESEDDTE